MKTYILPVLLLLASPAFADCQDLANADSVTRSKCIANSESKSKIDLKAALNQSFADLMSDEEKAAFNTAQKAWLGYRDAQCNFAATASGGSDAPLAAATCRTELNKQRIAYLSN